MSAVMLDVIVSRHPVKPAGLSEASPQQVIDLLRPCLRSLTCADFSPDDG